MEQPVSVASTQYSFIDLFCGAGGLSLGFQQAGFRLVHALDSSPAAVSTHAANVDGNVSCTLITPDIAVPASTIIVGGPPCQGFSSAGLRRKGDHRNSLVGCFAEIVVRSQPTAFVFENVEGFLTAEGGRYLLDLLSPLVESGYRIHLRKVNAANYGVPQHRKRVIAIGGLGWEPCFPEPSHAAHGAPGAYRVTGKNLTRTPTLADALEGLPPATTVPPGEVPGHFYRPLEGIDLRRATALKQGERMRDLPVELWHPSYQRRAFRRVKDGTPTERRGGAPSGMRRLVAAEPSKAITGGALTEFIHPVENRNLTIRECARIQTFPDNFTFCGTIAQQAMLIGNAVPPVLAHRIASSLVADLHKANPGDRIGALLSFVPTIAEGASPALRQVIALVRSQFRLDVNTGDQQALWL